MCKLLSTILRAFIFAVLIAVSGTFAVQAEMKSDYVTDYMIWELDTETGELVVSGTEKMPNDWTDNNYAKHPTWEQYSSYIKTVIISEGVENIGQFAFFEYEKLENVIISGSVTEIGNSAFYKCTNLESVTILNGLIKIGDSSFKYCEKLESIIIPDSVTEIGNSAFYECASLESLTIPASVTSIGNYAFEFCKNLRSVIFEGNAPELEGDYVFTNYDDFIIYYYEGTTGWESRDWSGYTTEKIPTAKTDIAAAEVEFECDISSLIYTGSTIEPTVSSVKIGDDAVVPYTEYTVTYGENICVNKGGSIIITAVQGSKYYCGLTTIDFTINPKTLSVNPGTYAVTKEYDGITDATASGELGLCGVVKDDKVTVKIGTLGEYPNVNTGKYSVILSDLELDGADMTNYKLSDNTYIITNAEITPADYIYNVDAEQEIKIGSNLSAITVAPASGTGVILPDGNNENVSGTLKWHTNNETSTEARDEDLGNLEIGESVTLWWSFTAGNPNYTSETKTGSTVFKIINSDPQTINFDAVTNNAVSVIYGDIVGLDYPATLSVGTGNVSYSGSDPTVATVDNAGTLTILKAGKTTVTATAAAVPGVWAETSVSYELTVNPKPITGVSIEITHGDDVDILTAVVAGLVSGEDEESADTLTFAWNGINGVSADKNYIVNSESANTEITVTVTASGNYSGIFTSIPVTVGKTPDYAGNPGTDILCGDVNGDGKVNIADLICLSRHIAGIEIITNLDLLEAAKVNGYVLDNEIGPAELVRLAQWIAEINLTPLGQALD